MYSIVNTKTGLIKRGFRVQTKVFPLALCDDTHLVVAQQAPRTKQTPTTTQCARSERLFGAQAHARAHADKTTKQTINPLTHKPNKQTNERQSQ